MSDLMALDCNNESKALNSLGSSCGPSNSSSSLSFSDSGSKICQDSSGTPNFWIVSSTSMTSSAKCSNIFLLA